MQPAHVPDQFVAGTQMEMIGIRQDQGRAQFGQLARLNRFYGCLCANGRKYRCVNRAMRCVKDPGPCASVFGFNGIRKRHAAVLSLLDGSRIVLGLR